MLTRPSFKKSLIVEQFQGNYLKLTDFRRDILMFRIAEISQCVNNYFETEKS